MINHSGSQRSPDRLIGNRTISAVCLSICTWSIFLMVLLLTGCSSVFRADVSKSPEINNWVVEVDPAHQVCELAGDCGLAYVDCSTCDCGVPVNTDFIDFYTRRYADVCRNYTGAVCEIECPPVILTCQSGLCGIEPAQ